MERTASKRGAKKSGRKGAKKDRRKATLSEKPPVRAQKADAVKPAKAPTKKAAKKQRKSLAKKTHVNTLGSAPPELGMRMAVLEAEFQELTRQFIELRAHIVRGEVNRAPVENLNNFFKEPPLTEAIERILNQNFKDPEAKEEGIKEISEFVLYFSLFQCLKPLRTEIYRSILDAIEMAENPSDLRELLQKSVLLRLVELYVDIASVDQKEKILNILSTSLETVAPEPLFLKIGQIVRPIVQDTTFQAKMETQQEKEIVYAQDYQPITNADVEIKSAIDVWLKSQPLNLDAQNILQQSLKTKFEEECFARGIPARPDLLQQCQEMLSMQLTLLSLQMSSEEEAGTS
ncbi:MAG: hypothetical protein RBG13Loki_2377 [Promethearchaeota archaeon CR_4]|nr:MAG: hypothetical protein RBG13Loki_2377 [Candidatus Lokiarchaeota archaeon CR_4]